MSKYQSFASIASSKSDKPTNHVRNNNSTPNIVNESYFNEPVRECVVGYTPPSKNCDFVQWQYYYYSELLDMYNIFTEKFTPEFPRVSLNSIESFNKFCEMIYNASSGFVETERLGNLLPEKIEEFYFHNQE